MPLSSSSPLPDTIRHSVREVFLVFLQLGLTSFGGPAAHLGYFREAFVVQRRWLGEQAYADLVALCQFLPGPASSQVGMGLGLMRAGYGGALAAWAGFTLPSAILLVLAAQGLVHWGSAVPPGLLHGLHLAAIAVILQAVWSMGKAFCRGPVQLALMLAATLVVMGWGAHWAGWVIVMLALAGGAGVLLLRSGSTGAAGSLRVPVGSRAAVGWLMLFAALLALSVMTWTGQAAQLLAAFYRTGSLVFGGGHVVLPLLEGELVQRGWVEAPVFLAGYGLAQAVPGPLFTFAAFLGATMQSAPTGWTGASLALLAIFLPAFLLVAGALPFWERWRHLRWLRSALQGINAAVVGLLLAALLQQGAASLHQWADLLVTGLALWLLMRLRWAPWLVVLVSALAGWASSVLLPVA